jgi:hypothetical protein
MGLLTISYTTPLTPPTELSETRKKIITAYIPRWRGEARCQVAAAGNAKGGLKVELKKVVVQAVIKP